MAKGKKKILKKLEKAVVKQEEVSDSEFEELEKEVQEPDTENNEGLGIEKEEKEESGYIVEESEEKDEEDEL